MFSPNGVVEWFDDFLGSAAGVAAGTAFRQGWEIDDISAAGAPTYATVDDDATGAFAMTLAATSETETVTLSWGDIRSIDIDNIQHLYFRAKVAGVDSVTVIVMGLAEDIAADEDTIASSVWFKMEGATSTSVVVVESDDGTNDNNDVSTGALTLASTYKQFHIDLTDKTDVKFFMEDGNTHMVQVATGTTFDMSNETGSLQPYFQVHKASGTGVPALTLDYVCLQYKRES